MAIRVPKPEPSSIQPTHQPTETKPCTRDRLLAAIAHAPRLRSEDAARIDQAVREAREASLADELSS